MKCLTVLCLACLFATASGRVNYCGSRMCGNTNSHTFCRFSPGPGPLCSGYIEAQLSRAEKIRVLARLNQRRNDAAAGRLKVLPSAGNMLKLRWIEELAKEAQLWANQCRPPNIPEDHDDCRDLFSISVGQCVASVVGEAPGLKIESMVDMWYMQSLLYKGNVTTYIPSKHFRNFYGDFGQMMWSRSYMVGCGRSRFMIPWQGRMRSVERLVCNFSPSGPPPYRALWNVAVSATTCPPRSHPDKTYRSLCNYQFKMDDTDIIETMPIEEHVLLNSVLEIEKNESLHRIGGLDELYLTNLAIVTMDNIESSSTVYNSIHKRDVAEASALENYNVNNRDKQNELNTTQTVLGNINKNSKTSKKKISTVGRPKTYNMAELTENGDDPKEDIADDEVVEDVPKNFNSAYGDYNIIVETQEGNETTVNGKSLERKTEQQRPSDYISTESFALANKLTDDTTSNAISINIFDSSTINGSMLNEIEFKEVANATELNVALNADLNETLTEKEKSIDYLTDPETVRELQNALEHMENEMQTSKVTAKVRRDLREPDSQVDSNEDHSTSSPEATTSTDKSHMLNLVLDYLPYLKQYQGEIMGTSAVSSSSVKCECLYPSVILFMYVLV